MANKFGGTLVANTNTTVGTHMGGRVAITVYNLSSTSTISADFGAAASTDTADGSWYIPAGGTLFLTAAEYPEIVLQLNLKSTGTPSYIVRDSTAL
jgi:hypothetical protein